MFADKLLSFSQYSKMATLTPFSTLFSTCRPNFTLSSSSSSSSSLALLRFSRFNIPSSISNSSPNLAVVNKFPSFTLVRSVAEGSTLIDAEEVADQPVSVPVSPSDVLLMSFRAEGTMSETQIPKVTEALKVVDGITSLTVGVDEGIASVELVKETTVQATGVASSLVEIIQGAGFKLQTLLLSFQDDDDFN